MSRSVRALGGAAAMLLLAGCGGGKDNPMNGGDGGADRDLVVRLSGMGPHVGQLVEMRVVSADDALVARAILDPLTAVIDSVKAALALPDGAHRLDFYADLSGDRSYEAPPADHAWRIALADSGDVDVAFVHNTTFTDIASPAITEPGGDFTFNGVAFGPHLGQEFEVRVIEEDSGRTVGVYRLGAIPAADFTVAIPGVIEDGVSYRIDYYADYSGSGSYDAPPADHAWRLVATGTASGLTLNAGHNTVWTDIGF